MSIENGVISHSRENAVKVTAATVLFAAASGIILARRIAQHRRVERDKIVQEDRDSINSGDSGFRFPQEN